MSYDYEFRLRIQAPRSVAFERLLRIEHLARWFCGWARIEPKVGGFFKSGGETCLFLPEGLGWSTVIAEGETLKRFAFLWPIQGAPTRVTYDLQDEGASECVVQVRHTGLPTRETTCGSVQDAWRVCLGNLKAIPEGRSDGLRPDHTPVLTPELRLATIIDAPSSRVFEAIAGPAEANLREQGRFPWNSTGTSGELLEAELPDRIVFRWPGPSRALRVSIDLEEKSSGTAVYLQVTGYKDGDAPEIVRDRESWSDRLTALRNLVETRDVGFLNPYEAQVQET